MRWSRQAVGGGTAAVVALLVLLPAGGCSGLAPAPAAKSPAFRPTRRDYAAFRAGFPGLPEPNYLPFVVHRVPAWDARGDALVFCRWTASQMPIRVSIEPPEIPASLQDELRPVSSQVFVDAVVSALRTYETTLSGAVRFERVAHPERATLRVRVVGEIAPAPAEDVAVLGATALGGACRVEASDPGADRLDVRFEANEMRVYVADDFGLLTREQVERVALHELGHALGIRGHSPIPADLMYEVANDHMPEVALSHEDTNTLRALYRIPNGTLYGWLEPGASEIAGAPAPGPGPPALAGLPRAHRGLRFLPPRGWQLGETPYGVYAIDGTPWDYDASLQLVVQPAASAEGYLAQREAAHVGTGWVRERTSTAIAGRRGVRLEIEGRIAGIRERLDVIELDSGRVLIAIADAAEELYASYGPWFNAVLETIEVEPAPPRP